METNQLELIQTLLLFTPVFQDPGKIDACSLRARGSGSGSGLFSCVSSCFRSWFSSCFGSCSIWSCWSLPARVEKRRSIRGESMMLTGLAGARGGFISSRNVIKWSWTQLSDVIDIFLEGWVRWKEAAKVRFLTLQLIGEARCKGEYNCKTWMS